MSEGITLKFDTRTKFYTINTPTKFDFDSMSPSKIIVFTVDEQTDRNALMFFCFYY